MSIHRTNGEAPAMGFDGISAEPGNALAQALIRILPGIEKPLELFDWATNKATEYLWDKPSVENAPNSDQQT